ncbi:MAG: histidinol dehydrogenase, partial [Actinomycetota bacterium]|nr:histidinol dehydrogenase [Actinomycetota bacterium]
MIRRIDLRGVDRSAAVDPGQLPRAAFDVEAALDAVRPICADVARRGLDAVRDATARFDGVEQDEIAVPTGAAVAALDRLDPDVRAALE